MSKLYFHYGTVSSSKTLNLLCCAHNYEEQHKKPVIIKPAIDTRSEKIESRAGLSKEATICLDKDDSLLNYYAIIDGASVILVDEVQFLTTEQIMELRMISLGTLGTRHLNPIPVLTYGLRTMSDGTLWNSIKTLMAVADEIHEIKTICVYCDRKAVFSKEVAHYDEAGVRPSWDGYIPVCPKHYYEK